MVKFGQDTEAHLYEQEMMMPRKSATTHPLTGKFFHTFIGDDDSRRVQYQGKILAVAENGVLCQLYEWFIGSPSNERWFPLSAVESWNLYPSIEAMNDAYEHVHRFQTERYIANAKLDTQ